MIGLQLRSRLKTLRALVKKALVSVGQAGIAFPARRRLAKVALRRGGMSHA
jgi:hypothetical protein